MKYRVISYDISDNKRLKKVAKILEGYGVRVQQSVFEIYCNDIIFTNIRKKLDFIIKNDDSIAYQSFCIKDWKKIKKYGIQSSVFHDEKTYIVL